MNPRAWIVIHLLSNPLQSPIPRFKLKCPVCENKSPIFFKDYVVFQHPLHPTEYRMDILLKCGKCSFVMIFGEHIPKEFFLKLNEELKKRGIKNRRVSWNHLKKHIDITKLVPI